MQTIQETNCQIQASEIKPRPASRKRSLRLTAVDCVVSIVLVVIALEVLFTLAGVGQEEFLQFDDKLGCSPMPGKSLTFRTEGFSRSTFNSFGMREREVCLSKPPGVVRIAMLGDSMTEALHVDRKQTFTGLLENKLNAGSEKKNAEVLNFGVSSYYLPQKYLRLKHLALGFQPDLAIIEMRCGESIELMPKPLTNLVSARPFFLVDGNEKLVESHVYMNQFNEGKQAKRMRATAWLRRNSSLWGVIGNSIQRLMGAKEPAKSSADLAAAKSGGKKESTYKFVSIDPYLKRLTRALLMQAKEDCEKKNCRLAVMYLTGLHGLRFEEEEVFLEKVTAGLGIPFLNMQKPIEDNYYASKEPLAISHFAPRGHRLAADELSSFVRKNYPDLFPTATEGAAEMIGAKEQKNSAL